MNWKYKGKDILSHDDLDDKCTDFVYCLTFKDGMKYIGKKTIRSERRLKPTKEQLAIRKNYKRVEVKDIPFVKYVGSSVENKGREVVSKDIIYCCSNKRTATYLETRLLMGNKSIESNELFTNKNVLGRFFDNCLDGLIKD